MMTDQKLQTETLPTSRVRWSSSRSFAQTAMHSSQRKAVEPVMMSGRFSNIFIGVDAERARYSGCNRHSSPLKAFRRSLPSCFRLKYLSGGMMSLGKRISPVILAVFCLLQYGLAAEPQQQVTVLKYVVPIYPAIAKTARINGDVVLSFNVESDGSVSDVQYVSGPKMLLPTCLDAIKQW